MDFEANRRVCISQDVVCDIRTTQLGACENLTLYRGRWIPQPAWPQLCPSGDSFLFYPLQIGDVLFVLRRVIIGPAPGAFGGLVRTSCQVAPRAFQGAQDHPALRSCDRWVDGAWELSPFSVLIIKLTFSEHLL